MSGRRKKKSRTQGIIKTAKNVLSPMRLFEGKRKDIVDKLKIKFYIRFDQFHKINNKRKKESWLLPESVACLVQIHLTGHASILQRKGGESDNESKWCESDELDSDSDSVDICSIISVSWDCTDDDEGKIC